MTNTGNQPVTITAITLAGSGASEVQLLTGATTDCAATTTLGADEKCDLRARFDPGHDRREVRDPDGDVQRRRRHRRAVGHGHANAAVARPGDVGVWI